MSPPSSGERLAEDACDQVLSLMPVLSSSPLSRMSRLKMNVCPDEVATQQSGALLTLATDFSPILSHRLALACES